MTHNIDIVPAELRSTHCRRDCRECPLEPYPETEWCTREKGSIYIVEGKCNRCGICCGNCVHLYWEGSISGCDIQKNKPDACKMFPTIHDFLQDLAEPEGNALIVPKECSFRLKRIK